MAKVFDTALQGRITIVLLFFFIALAVLGGRLFVLQVLYHKEYEALASRQQQFTHKILSERGSIFTQERDGTRIPVALNKTFFTVVASPKHIVDPEGVADILRQTLEIDEEVNLKAMLSKRDDPYEVVAQRVDSKRVEQLQARAIPGIFFEEERRRLYPHGLFAANLLGFVSKEVDVEEGRYGLERSYEETLSGEQGIFRGVKDTAGFWLALGRRIINPSKDGSDIVLTVDHNVQQKAEAVLDQTMKKWLGDSGTIMVLNPQSGGVLAMASRPAFDLNAYHKEEDFSVFLNPLVESTYELGSVLKPITMAGALDAGLVNAQTTYNDTGSVRIAGYTIKNFDGEAYHTQTMTQVLEKSLNTGAIYVAELLGIDRHRAYLENFGFGEKTGIDLPGEVSGNLSNLDARRPIDFATASFGQGFSATPLQLAIAMAAIANDGKLMKPYVVDTIIDGSGNEFRSGPEEIRQVVSPEAAEELTKMLVSAVRNGFENRAGVKGYFVAGKTGTAQIPKKDGRGYSDEVIHTFVGYAPAFDPKFLIYLQLNKPLGNRFAANTLTPAFHDLAEYILNYYEIPPDEIISE